MNTVDLLVNTKAKVLSAWRDDDGYGNTDRDYMTMSLQIPTWGNDSTLTARVLQDDDDGDGKMVPDRMYDIKGSLFYEVPSKAWTCTYLHVDHFSPTAASASVADADADAKAPTFSLIAQISELTDSHVTVMWGAWDPYEAAMFNSHAKLQLKQAPVTPRLEVNQIVEFQGYLEAPGRDQLVVEGYTQLRGVRSPLAWRLQ